MAKQQVVNLPFPIKGINRDTGHDVLPDRQTQTMLNVRPHDSIQGRARGGSRPSIAKWFDTQIADGFMQALEKGAVQKSSLEVSSSSYYVQGSPGVELTYNTIDITTGETIASVGLDGTDSTSVLIGSAPGIALSLRSGRTILQAHQTDFPYSRIWGFQLDSTEYDDREIDSIAVDVDRDRVYVVYESQALLTALRLSDGRKQWEIDIEGTGNHPTYPRQNRIRVAKDTGQVYVVSGRTTEYTLESPLIRRVETTSPHIQLAGESPVGGPTADVLFGVKLSILPTITNATTEKNLPVELTFSQDGAGEAFCDSAVIIGYDRSEIDRLDDSEPAFTFASQVTAEVDQVDPDHGGLSQLIQYPVLLSGSITTPQVDVIIIPDDVDDGSSSTEDHLDYVATWSLGFTDEDQEDTASLTWPQYSITALKTAVADNPDAWGFGLLCLLSDVAAEIGSGANDMSGRITTWVGPNG